jgi:hypothetical protein
MAAYLTKTELASLSVMPASYVTELETLELGWVDAQLANWSAWLDSRLRKRYAAPFALPAPIAVTNWLQRIVTHRCYLKRGIDPTDAQAAAIREDAEAAMREVAEAAASDTGLFDLPASTANAAASAITKTAPLGYSETSPYTWTAVQRDLADDERSDRGGS